MANTAVAAGLTVQQWDSDFWTEYVRINRFKSAMGTDENAIIQMQEELGTKKGKSVTFALINTLTGAGKSGSETLVGSEEAMLTRSCEVSINKIRNAVVVPEIDEQFSAIPLRNASKVALKNWILNRTKDDIISALGQVSGDYYAGIRDLWSNTTTYKTVQDTWCAGNEDRILFGQTTANHSGVYVTDLAKVDSTNDLLTAARLVLM
jgi:hypothetical protein